MTLLNFLRVSAQTNNLPDISYLANFKEQNINGEIYVSYHWKIAKQIGIDLADYILTIKQLNNYKSNNILVTNVVKIDNKAFELYEQEIKNTRLKWGGFGLITGIVATSVVILISKAAN